MVICMQSESNTFLVQLRLYKKLLPLFPFTYAASIKAGIKICKREFYCGFRETQMTIEQLNCFDMRKIQLQSHTYTSTSYTNSQKRQWLAF